MTQTIWYHGKHSLLKENKGGVRDLGESVFLDLNTRYKSKKHDITLDIRKYRGYKNTRINNFSGN